MLVVFAGAIIGVLIEAFASKSIRPIAQVSVSIGTLVLALVQVWRIRNSGSTTAAMGSVIIDGPISADSITGSSLDTNKITLSTQSSINTIISSSIKSGIFNATEIVDPPFPVNSFSGVLVEYVAQRQTAIRAGMLYASWSGSSISYTDVSNADVGETWDLSFNFIKVDNNILLRAYSLGSGSGEWTIQFLFKMFPTLL
jgi:hypothetical protein